MWRKLKSLLPWYRRAEERDMQEELASLEAIAGRKELGNLTLAAENARGEWEWTALGNLFRDARYALRGLLRDRAFTAVAVLSIALGVGANSAIFSLVDQALYRMLPVRDPERLVLLDWNGRFVGPGWGSSNLLPHPLYRDLAAANDVFDGMFCRFPAGVHVSLGGELEPASAEFVSGTYFPVLGLRPAIGRLLDESDDARRGEHPVVVVSFDFWRNRLGGTAGAVGRTMVVNKVPLTVIGVAPEGFHGFDWGNVSSLWIPTMMKPQVDRSFDWLDNRRGRWLHVFGRLKSGISVEAARNRLQPWFKRMLEEDMTRPDWPPVSAEERKAYLASQLDMMPAANGRSDLRRQLERPLLVLLAATVMVLLLACLNVANLSLARGFARRRETALRIALGASRRRIVQAMLVQSALLASGGAALGILLAPALARALISFLPADVALTPGVSARVFLFALGVAVATSLLFGLAPAFHSGRTRPADALRENSTTVAGGIRLRKVLVTSQIALAVVLLIGAGLFVRTLAALRAQGPGFETTNLLRFGIQPGLTGHSPEQSKRVAIDVMAALRALPEVKSAGFSWQELLSGYSWGQFLTVEAGDRRVTERIIRCNGISPGFFETLGVPLLRGRDFNERDWLDGPDATFRSAIINESFARRHFGDRNPIGARLGLGHGPDTKTAIEIVGVVATFSYRGLRVVDDQAFFPAFEGNGGTGNVFVRTRVPSGAALSSIRAAVRRIDPRLPLSDVRTIDDQLDRSLLNERLLATLATAFAGLAILLAVVGLYGVMSFVVSRRTREIGIRLALGCPQSSAIRLMLRDAGVMLVIGIAAAIPTVWALGRFVESQLFGVRPMDWTTIAASALLLAAVGFAASAIPAQRAAARSVTETLRCE